MPTTRYECILCDEHHMVKSEDYGKHLMKHHQEAIIVSSSLYYMTLHNVKNNKLPYITIKNYDEVVIPHEEAFMCLCCNMYYTKPAYAEKHRHKEFDALTVHNAKMEEYLERYADKMKYNINGKKAKKDIQNTKSLGYEIVYKLVPECCWTGTQMVQVIDQEATYKNQLAYEATLPKKETLPELEYNPDAKTRPVKPAAAESTGDFPKEFMITMLKQIFNSVSAIYVEDLLLSKAFQNNILEKFTNNEEITNGTIEEESEKLTENVDAMELEEAERNMLEYICPKPMLKKLGVSYDELFTLMKA